TPATTAKPRSHAPTLFRLPVRLLVRATMGLVVLGFKILVRWLANTRVVWLLVLAYTLTLLLPQPVLPLTRDVCAQVLTTTAGALASLLAIILAVHLVCFEALRRIYPRAAFRNPFSNPEL